MFMFPQSNIIVQSRVPNSNVLDIPLYDLLQAKIKCEVIVNTRNQTVSRQSCYPEVSFNCLLI